MTDHCQGSFPRRTTRVRLLPDRGSQLIQAPSIFSLTAGEMELSPGASPLLLASDGAPRPLPRPLSQMLSFGRLSCGVGVDP